MCLPWAVGDAAPCGLDKPCSMKTMSAGHHSTGEEGGGADSC